MKSSSLFLKKRRGENLTPLSFYRLIIDKLNGVSKSPEWEAREIIYALSGKKVSDFFLSFELKNEHLKALEGIIERRKNGEPLSYILGNTEFMGFNLKVDERVLIPRDDTETLVNEVLKYPAGRVLDIGTGSGAIAISLASYGFDVVATDVSKEAISLARENALDNGVKIDFRVCSFFKCIRKKERFDYIVSNPPYISSREFDYLDREVKKEPRVALLSRFDGMWHTYRILIEARKFLRSGGRVFIEISPLRTEKYLYAAHKLGYTEVEVIKDLNGNYRVLKTRWEKNGMGIS